MQTRRIFLAEIAAVSAAGAARRSYTYAEIERMLARGDLSGKIAKDDLPTPALLLDLDLFEANIARMTGHLRQRKLALRPHGKTHKCPEIAKALIRAGAVGACTAKISEAEAFAREDVTGLLITTAVVGRHKIERAIRLARRRPETIFSVDNARNVRDLNDAAAAARVKLNVAVDLRVGNRTGIQPGEPALGLAQQIASLSNVRLAGIQAYAGHASHTAGFENRIKVSREAMGQAVETRRLFEAKGIACPWLSGGSTGTYNIDPDIEGVTELQPGSFIFMDIDYNRIGGSDGAVYKDFHNALTVLTTVVSKPAADTAIVDGGLKAFSTDKPFVPESRKREGIAYAWAGDEHGRLTLTGATAALDVGDRVEFVVPHCDPTVNLYDRIYCLRGDAVEKVWRVSARGMSQ
ncbi:MAG: DSD1 family PLP-dependent enzyme [Acidobacteriota bacterium]|mgnify:FL=1